MAVQGVSLTLHAGQLIHIMGPSGSGKTTLLSMLGMLIPPTSGRLEILGEMTAGMSQPALTSLRLRTIGFVFQNFQLIDALTVTENVELPMNFVDIRRPHSTTRAKRLLEELGLSTKCHFRPRVLSGGEKQRVAIARAFANYPPLIFADEPTGSLDSHTGQSVIELLRNAADKRGTAVLVVSHDPRIRGYADQVLQMEDGMLHDTNSESVESINELDRV
jgi:putative ABC transport system ATP-binding protein